MNIGDKIIDFSLPTTGGKTLSSLDLKQKKFILFSYPKDDTPGWAIEVSKFREYYDPLREMGYEIFGISKDSIKSHEKFKEKKELPFELICDEQKVLLDFLEVSSTKKILGFTERSTFVFNESGLLTHSYRKVKPNTHVEELVNDLKA